MFVGDPSSQRPSQILVFQDNNKDQRKMSEILKTILK